MMNQEDIFKKIGQILNELQDQYEFLAQNPRQLNELELELFLANANFLSDHVQIIRKINNNVVVKELPEHFEIQKEKIVQKEEIIEEKKAIAPPMFEFILDEAPSTDKFEFEEKPIESIFDRPLSKEEEEIIAEKQRLVRAAQLQKENEDQQEIARVAEAEEAAVEDKLVQEEVLSAPVPDNRAEEKVIIPPVTLFSAPEEKESTPRPTLNDLLAGKNNQNSTYNQESSKPAITDLKQAINLNEKLLYIKDLFNGYNLAYAEAIELINKMPDLKTADTFLKNNYAVKNNWESKQNTVDKFYALLGQRFQD